jgi:hypothetical protein
MSRTLFKGHHPVFQSFRQLVIPRVAVHSTPRTVQLESADTRSRTITREPANAPARRRRQRDIEKEVIAYLKHQHLHSSKATLHSPSFKMSFLLPGLRRGLMLSTPLILSTPLLLQYRYAQPIRCDGPDPISRIKNDLMGNYTSEARTPIITESGAANPRAIRQVSMGSILGVLGGLGVSLFSKPLAILIGLGVILLQVSHEMKVQAGHSSVKSVYIEFATCHLCKVRRLYKC